MMKKYAWLSVSFATLFVPLFVFGQGEGGGGIQKIDNPLGVGTLNEFLLEVIKVVRDLGILVAVIFIVYAGFMFVTARGDEAKLTKAKNALLWAVIGTAVILGAQVLANAINTTIDSL